VKITFWPHFHAISARSWSTKVRKRVSLSILVQISSADLIAFGKKKAESL